MGAVDCPAVGQLLFTGAHHGNGQVGKGRPRAFDWVMQNRATFHPAFRDAIAHPWQGKLQDDVGATGQQHGAIENAGKLRVQFPGGEGSGPLVFQSGLATFQVGLGCHCFSVLAVSVVVHTPFFFHANEECAIKQ